MSLSNPKAPSSIDSASKVLNGYLWDSLKKIDPGLNGYYGTVKDRQGNVKEVVPIVPLHDSAGENMTWGDKPYLIYNKVFSRPKDQFYPVKREVFHFGLKAGVAQTFEWLTAIQMILDRQDDAAKDINKWNATSEDHQHVFFHHLRIFQIERTEPRDYSVKPAHITEFMVVAEYHYTEPLSYYFKNA